jgi:hypothetical protein
MKRSCVRVVLQSVASAPSSRAATVRRHTGAPQVIIISLGLAGIWHRATVALALPSRAHSRPLAEEGYAHGLNGSRTLAVKSDGIWVTGNHPVSCLGQAGSLGDLDGCPGRARVQGRFVEGDVQAHMPR